MEVFRVSYSSLRRTADGVLEYLPLEEFFSSREVADARRDELREAAAKLQLTSILSAKVEKIVLRALPE